MFSEVVHNTVEIEAKVAYFETRHCPSSKQEQVLILFFIQRQLGVGSRHLLLPIFVTQIFVSSSSSAIYAFSIKN